MFTDASTAWPPGRPTPRKGDPAPSEPLSQLRRLCGQEARTVPTTAPEMSAGGSLHRLCQLLPYLLPLPETHSLPTCMRADRLVIVLTVRKRGRKKIGWVQCQHALQAASPVHGEHLPLRPLCV